MSIPQNLKYTKEHEWIKVEGTTGLIGVTYYAQGELGDVVFVDIDTTLSEVKKDEAFGTIEAVKTVSDLFAPCSGKVTEINPAINTDPSVINSDPYGNGWLIKIEITELAQIDELLNAEDYQKLIGK